MKVGCYPGSFNPLTRAHLALAEAAVAQCGIDRIDLVVSRAALGKLDLAVPTLEHRIEVLEAAAATRPWLGVAVTDAQLLVDVAEGYDALVMGADKWAQVVDAAWYASAAERDGAVARLAGRVWVAARPPHDHADPRVRVLELADELAEVSATAVRDGRVEWMAAEAAAFDARTGAWTDVERYRQAFGIGRPDGAGG